jgi:exosortase
MTETKASNSLREMASRATKKDVGLFALIAVLIAEGPLTPASLLPSIGVGVLGALLFLYWRLSRPTRPQTRADALRWNVPPGVWLCLGLFAIAAAPTLGWMYQQWTGSVWHNTHGLLIPLLMIMLGRNILRRMQPVEDEPSLWGFAFVVPGLVLLLVDAGAATQYVSAMGIVISLPGLSLLTLGPTRTRALALPLSLGIFMIPLPNTFASQIYLRTMTADAVAPILTAIGIPTFVDKSLLELPHASFLVANSCSGFSTLYSAVAIGVLLGTLCPSPRRRLLVYLSIVPLALLANVVRVVVLVLIAVYVDESLLDTGAHAGSGVLTFFGVLAVLILLADRPRLARALL